MKYTIGQAQHIGKRKQQQDRFGHAKCEASGLVAVIVADGMGGMAHGDVASQVAVDTFLATWVQGDAAQPIGQALRDGMLAANAKVFERARELEAAGEVGTTLIAAAFAPDGMHWISVGDSGIFHLRGGAARQVNQFHNYGRELDLLADQGVLPRRVVLNHPDREALTSFVGLEEIRLVDASENPVPIEAGDLVVLASDGLFRTIEPKDLPRLAHGNAQKVCDEMVRWTLAAGDMYQDNVTVLAVRAEEEARRSKTSLALPLLGAAGAAAAWMVRRSGRKTT